MSGRSTLPSITTRSERETHTLAAEFASTLQPGDVVGLEGPLGAGKTCFVRGLLEGLGGRPAEVSSPTFVIMQEYEAGSEQTLVHVDAYRLQGMDDLESIGWEEVLQNRESNGPPAIVAVEWPSRITEAMPDGWIEVILEPLARHERKISFTCPEGMSDRLAAAVQHSS